MIPIPEALVFAETHFPQGPERLAEHLGVVVRSSPLGRCDGWCLKGEAQAIIHINSDSVPSRQRFTLAHELGHLLLDMPSVIGESPSDFLRSDDGEERHVNDIAAELLLPRQVVRKTVTELPVVAAVLKRLAKRANISELAAVLRVANLAAELGLQNASVVFFEGDTVSWQWSRTISMPDDVALALRENAAKVAPAAFRYPREREGDLIVASSIENPFFGSATLFVQLLPIEYENQKSRDERRGELEAHLFDGKKKFQNQLQGCFGSFKPRMKGMSLQQAEAAFWEQYLARFQAIPGNQLASAEGREYVRLRLEEWCET